MHLMAGMYFFFPNSAAMAPYLGNQGGAGFLGGLEDPGGPGDPGGMGGPRGLEGPRCPKTK